MDKEAKKAAFTKLLNDKGYKSMYSFCHKNNIDSANMSKRIIGVRQKIEISSMFKIANLLHCPVEDIIKIFYPDEWKENRELMEDEE